jgi:glycosyl-4,4'-diaponeurosporenoate acyltransferase
MKPMIWLVNILGWPLIHLCAAYLALRVPDRYFSRDCWITLPRPWERSGRFYRKGLRISCWKSILPDGAPWVGGFSKKRLRGHHSEYLERFLLETRRAEIAHWGMLVVTPVFFLWNPRWACGVMALYAIAANVPCILVQRHNRFSLARMVSRARLVRVNASETPSSEP